MKSLRTIFLISFSVLTCNLIAQKLEHIKVDSTSNAVADDTLTSLTSIAKDTVSENGEIPQGVIYVRRAHLTPFVKVDYKLFLAHVNPRGSQILIPVTDKQTGFTQQETYVIPSFDSNAYSKKLKRVYPISANLYSKYFVENMHYQYQPSDTPRVDTIVVGMWIDTRGRTRWRMADTSFTGNMPKELVNEIATISETIPNWGTGGGYATPKKLFRPAKLTLESYYCELYVIVSSYPLTKEQKKSGTSYSPFDYPLNSPATDKEHQNSIETNIPTTSTK